MASPLPNKVLKIDMTVLAVIGTITDPAHFWFGYPAKWQVKLTVKPMIHGNSNSPSSFQYSVDDIQVGDWIATSSGGVAVRITHIENITGNVVVCGVEDVESQNIVLDSTFSGIGIGPSGRGILFSLDDNGLPKLGPVPAYYMDQSFQSDLYARFQHRNVTTKYIQVNQINHGFSLGNIIRPEFSNPGKFALVAADVNVNDAIGVVSSVGIPTEDWFTFTPFGKVVNGVAPPLNGVFGDFFYLDPNRPGNITNIKPTTSTRPIYMRLDASDSAILLNQTSINPPGSSEGIKRYTVAPTANQIEFVIPGAHEILYMSINGIENDNFIFDNETQILLFDPIATGYGVDSEDEVFFVYK